MKVGILAHNLASLRGGVKLSLILGSNLKDAGFDVAYACAKEDLKNLEKKFGMELKFKIYKPKSTFLRDKMINITSLWNQGIPAYRLCREFKPDVVIEIGGVITPLLIPWFLKVPTIHYCYCPASLYKEFTYYKQSWMQNLYPAFVSKIESFAIKRADKVISMCNFSRGIVKKTWGIDTVSIPPYKHKSIQACQEEKSHIKRKHFYKGVSTRKTDRNI
ncbi:MAG: glycosyltransferase [Nanoarchaeota archaeon]|nr:glycosyltransferase [Nanoarchaeota archaeon]